MDKWIRIAHFRIFAGNKKYLNWKKGGMVREKKWVILGSNQ